MLNEENKFSVNEFGGLECTCGNTVDKDGFYPCNLDGEEVEPDENWSGLYVCSRCGNVDYLE